VAATVFGGVEVNAIFVSPSELVCAPAPAAADINGVVAATTSGAVSAPPVIVSATHLAGSMLICPAPPVSSLAGASLLAENDTTAAVWTTAT